MTKPAGLACLVLLAVSGAARTSSSVTHPFAGITHIDRSLTTPRPIHVHVIQVDLATPGIRVMLTPPAGPRETIRQTTAAFVNGVHAQAGINAHSFCRSRPRTDRTG